MKFGRFLRGDGGLIEVVFGDAILDGGDGILLLGDGIWIVCSNKISGVIDDWKRKQK